MIATARLRPWVKICGVTRAADAECAVALGAAMIGLNFWPGSPRRVEPAAAREIAAAVEGRSLVAGVFVDADPDRIEELIEGVGLDLVQLHGDEPDAVVARFGPRALRALRAQEEVAPAGAGGRGSESLSLHWQLLQVPVFALLLEGPVGGRYGGSGVAWDWSRARGFVARAAAPVLIAGGIRPANVRDALRDSGAAGVDVASGVEASPGVKDVDKMQRLFEEIRRVAE